MSESARFFDKNRSLKLKQRLEELASELESYERAQLMTPPLQARLQALSQAHAALAEDLETSLRQETVRFGPGDQVSVRLDVGANWPLRAIVQKVTPLSVEVETVRSYGSERTHYRVSPLQLQDGWAAAEKAERP